MRFSALLSIILLAAGITAAPIVVDRDVECRGGGISVLNGDILSGNASPDVYDSGNGNGSGNGSPSFKDIGNGSANGNGSGNGNGSANPKDSGNGNNAAGATTGDQTAAKEAEALKKAAKVGTQ